MKKTTTISLLIILSVFTSSCFDRQTYITQEQNQTTQSEITMTSQLEATFVNVNDTINLAFRGKELITSNLIKQFYTINQHLPIWTNNMKPNRYSREMMKLFAKSAFYGLDTSFYQFASLSNLYNQLKSNNLKDRDKKALEYEILMTHNCFKIMSHLRTGVIQPDSSVNGVKRNPYPKSFSKKLALFINDDQLTEGILNLQPNSYEYRFLQAGLEKFIKNISLNKDSLNIPNPKTDSTKAYEATKKVLIANNYYPSDDEQTQQYINDVINSVTIVFSDSKMNSINISPKLDKDTAFFNGLKRFQKANGLHPDGVIGNNTHNALHINNMERFKQIAVNLERLRWQKKRPEKYVYVNIPSYKLRVLENGWIKKTYRVVVGAVYTETPELNGEMQYFITNPSWNVPYSISSKEILPKIIADSNYLARNNYRILDKNRMPVTEKIDWSKVNRENFNYSIQQGSGRGNALGTIKFIFPNPYNVYIHDTQSKSKFKQEIRAYSHGCMRLENPFELAKYIVESEKNISTDSLTLIMNRGERKQINLNKPIPVFVRYITCEANKKGDIIFYKDIYGKDEKLKEQLFASN